MNLEELIEEQRERIPVLKHIKMEYSSYYTYQDETKDEYINWGEKTKRYLEQHFRGDKHIKNFNKLYEEQDITPDQQKKLLAILEAFLEFPNVIEDTNTYKQPKGINIHTNISNTNTQSQQQSQQQGIEILIKVLEDQLSVSQLKEIKQVVEEAKGDLEKAKPKLIDKIKSFGENVTSNILANIITNPTIWALLG